MKLTKEEYNVLDTLAKVSGMDCWFCINQDEDGEDYVADLEEHEYMTLEEGIKLLIEGCVEENIDELSEEETYTLIQLLGKLLVLVRRK